MRTDFVVVPAPGFDGGLGLSARAKTFGVQALVAEASIEGLVRAVLPGFPRVDVRKFDAEGEHPVE